MWQCYPIHFLYSKKVSSPCQQNGTTTQTLKLEWSYCLSSGLYICETIRKENIPCTKNFLPNRLFNSASQYVQSFGLQYSETSAYIKIMCNLIQYLFLSTLHSRDSYQYSLNPCTIISIPPHDSMNKDKKMIGFILRIYHGRWRRKISLSGTHSFSLKAMLIPDNF